MLGNNLLAQENQSLEPKYIGNIVLVKDSEAIPLEQQKAIAQSKNGYFVISSFNYVKGDKSTLRVAQDGSLQFIAKVGAVSIDPFRLFNIFKLEQNAKKKQRFIKTGNVGIAGAKSGDIEMIPFDVEEYGKEAFKITVNQKLEPGEYVITIEGSRGIFNLFGID